MTEKIQQLKQFLRWFWKVAKRYWRSSEKVKAWGLFAIVVIFIVLTENASVFLNRYQGEFTTALTNKELDKFNNFLLLFGATLLGYLFVVIIKNLIQSKLELYWREWLTNDFLQRYFTDRAFYQINGNKDIDNPDQRISEDIESFVNQCLTYVLDFGENLLKGLLFISLLWGINETLVFVAIVTAVIQTLVSFFIGRILTPLNFKNLQYQADFRYSLVHVRNNSESNTARLRNL